MYQLKRLSIIVLAFLTTSCSTVFYGRRENVRFESYPAGAEIYINDKPTGYTTPAKIELSKSKLYEEPGFKGMKYEFRKEGYEPYILKKRLGTHIGSLILGNYLFAGLAAAVTYPIIYSDYLFGSEDPLLIQEAESIALETALIVGGAAVVTTLTTDIATGAVKNLPRKVKAELVPKNSIKEQKITAPIVENLANSTGVNTTNTTPTNEAIPALAIDNYREEVLTKLLSENKTIANNSTSTNATTITKPNASIIGSTSAGKISKTLNSQQIDSNKLTFRRSSLYTLITNKEDRPYEHVIINAFGNTPLSEKFNDHNIGPYRIPVAKEIKDDNTSVTEYLNENKVARDVVAKWFNRSASGGFNMDLVAERGNYDATEMRVNIAKGSARGLASISDAGEELIGNTFVIVYDFKFTNKEEVAKKAKTGLKILKFASDYMPGGDVISTAADVGSIATTVAGKGYIIRTTSHLYRLVWNDSVANTFYDQMWTEDGNIDQKKKELFENTDLFTLKYVGYETAFADLQSTIFTEKSEEDLIRIATSKAADAAIAKLQRKFEEFRTKSPLYTGFPITAKIGMKEGLEGDEKFEVLEQTIDEKTGKTKYIRKGVISVDKNKIWDNRFMATEASSANGSITDSKALDRTYFKGSDKYYNGMLIRQIK